MKKGLFLFILFLAASMQVTAQENMLLTATIGRFRQYYNAGQGDSIFNIFSPRIQGLVPIDKTRQMVTQLQGSMGDMEDFKYLRDNQGFAYYRITFKQTKIILVASIDKDKLDNFRFIPDEPETQGAKEQSNFTLNTPTGKIYGTLSVPDGAKKVPVVLLVAGSGPTDRDGNNNMGLKTNTYSMIADSLKKAGIACLRFDKRGIGESAGAIADEAKLSFDDMVADVNGLINLLKKDTRFTDVVIAGHSEGSLIGMLAAQQGVAKKFISIAGAGECIDLTVKAQYMAQSKEVGEEAVHIIDSIKNGYEVKHISDGFLAMFRPSIQPYLRSLFKYDPQVEIKKVYIPVLLLQGKNDLQVSPANAALLKKAQPKAKLVEFGEMNHILKDTPAGRSENFATYANPHLPLSPGLIKAIVAFIKG